MYICTCPRVHVHVHHATRQADDGSLIVRGRVAYDPTGSATRLSEFDFPDGDAESVELDLRGTSVTGAWDARTRAFELTGPDTVDAYRRILASARYVNRGELRVIATQAPPLHPIHRFQ